MKKNLLIIVPLLVAGMLAFTRCSNDDCTEPPFCTQQFESILLKLTYPDGEPVLLDSCTVFWVSEDRFLEKNETTWKEARPFGSYLIVNDLMQRELEGKEEVMLFKGYLNDEIVCEREFLVGADHCHVDYYGEESLIQVIDRAVATTSSSK